MTKNEELYKICKNFINKNDITDSKSIYYLCNKNAFEVDVFIEEICKIVGYKEMDEKHPPIPPNSGWFRFEGDTCYMWAKAKTGNVNCNIQLRENNLDERKIISSIFRTQWLDIARELDFKFHKRSFEDKENIERHMMKIDLETQEAIRNSDSWKAWL